MLVDATAGGLPGTPRAPRADGEDKSEERRPDSSPMAESCPSMLDAPSVGRVLICGRGRRAFRAGARLRDGRRSDAGSLLGRAAEVVTVGAAGVVALGSFLLLDWVVSLVTAAPAGTDSDWRRRRGAGVAPRCGRTWGRASCWCSSTCDAAWPRAALRWSGASRRSPPDSRPGPARLNESPAPAATHARCCDLSTGGGQRLLPAARHSGRQSSDEDACACGTRSAGPLAVASRTAAGLGGCRAAAGDESCRPSAEARRAGR